MCPLPFEKIGHIFSYTECSCQNFSVSDVCVGLMMGILCSLICLPFS